MHLEPVVLWDGGDICDRGEALRGRLKDKRVGRETLERPGESTGLGRGHRRLERGEKIFDV